MKHKNRVKLHHMTTKWYVPVQNDTNCAHTDKSEDWRDSVFTKKLAFGELKNQKCNFSLEFHINVSQNASPNGTVFRNINGVKHVIFLIAAVKLSTSDYYKYHHAESEALFCITFS